MTLEGVSAEQLKTAVEDTKNRINDATLYFELKKRKLIRGNQSIDNIKTVLAMIKLHIPITAYSLLWVKGQPTKNSSSALSVLHQMGDKHLLVWKRSDNSERGSGNPFEWLPSPYLADLMAYIWKEK